MPYAQPVKPQKPNMQGTRGGPARGGLAARPTNDTVGPVPGPGGQDFMESVQALKDNPTFQQQVLSGANPQQAAEAAGTSGGGPGMVGGGSGPGVPVGAQPLGGGAAPVPAWQQLQQMGIAGQGSAAANRALLAEKTGQMPGGPPSGPIVADPGFTKVAPAGGMFGGIDPQMRQRLKQRLAAGRGQSGPAPVSRMPMNVPPEQPVTQPFQRPGVGRASMPRQPQLLE